MSLSSNSALAHTEILSVELLHWSKIHVNNIDLDYQICIVFMKFQWDLMRLFHQYYIILINSFFGYKLYCQSLLLARKLNLPNQFIADTQGNIALRELSHLVQDDPTINKILPI